MIHFVSTSQTANLFRYRLERLEARERGLFMKAFLKDFDEVTPQELQDLKEPLSIIAQSVYTSNAIMSDSGDGQSSTDNMNYATNGSTMDTLIRMKFHKIPFKHALDLVGKKEVFLRNGVAYVPLDKLVSILVHRFRHTLSRSLVEASHAFPMVTTDSRIGPLLKNMNAQYIGQNFNKQDQEATGGSKIGPKDIDGLAKQSFPMCMRELHRGLKQDSKLKYSGRMQYGLFVKGLGLSMEESLIFFQSIFTRIMSPEQFNKQYSYNIRHYYGKEGRRREMTAYSCSKIIIGESAPGVGEYHGCPFKHYDPSKLNRTLERTGGDLSFQERDELVKLSGEKKYQVACLKHFEYTHKDFIARKINVDNLGNHPNSWALASIRYHNYEKEPKVERQEKESGENQNMIEVDKIDHSNNNANSGTLSATRSNQVSEN